MPLQEMLALPYWGPAFHFMPCLAVPRGGVACFRRSRQTLTEIGIRQTGRDFFRGIQHPDLHPFAEPRSLLPTYRRPMKARFQIERVIVIGSILGRFWYIDQLRRLVGNDCIASTIVFWGIAALLVMALARRSTWVALWFAVIGVLSALRLAIAFFSAPHDHTLISDRLFLQEDGAALIVAFCAHRPNKSGPFHWNERVKVETESFFTAGES